MAEPVDSPVREPAGVPAQGSSSSALCCAEAIAKRRAIGNDTIGSVRASTSGACLFLRAVVCSAICTFGCARAPEQFKDAPVVLISIDTLRADHLPAYGSTTGRTPVIDSIASQGITFDDAISPVPLTLPAHASLLTGLLPPKHGVRDNIGYRLRDVPSVAGLLSREGYKTGAAVSSYVLRKQTGIAEGFEFFDDALTVSGDGMSLGEAQRDGSIAADSLATWIERDGGTRFLAFLHLYEPHTPYTPPPLFQDLSPYDGEIAHADEIVGAFVARLKKLNVWDKAIVVLTSDHGEGLGDHGESEHGIFLYRESVRVPLLVKLPGNVRVKTRVRHVVSLVDIVPTLVDLLGVTAPTPVDGRSLRSAIFGREYADTPAYSESLYGQLHFGWSPLAAATEERFRAIRAPKPELYDLANDPHEATNIASGNAARLDASFRWLGEKGKEQRNAKEIMDPAAVAAIQSLGYLGSQNAGASGTQSGKDPKDAISTYEDLKRGFSAQSRGMAEEAASIFRRVLAQEPSMRDAWVALGHVLTTLGDTKGAIAAFDRALRLMPQDEGTHIAIAKLYGLSGNSEKARAHAALAESLSPGQGAELSAELLMAQGRVDEAVAAARRAVAQDDTRSMAHFLIGVAAQRAGRCDEALPSFRRAEETLARERGARLRNLHASLGDCLARMGKTDAAETEFRKEIELIPSSREARVGYAMLLRSLSRDTEARAVLTGLLEAERPTTADTYAVIVKTFGVLEDGEMETEWKGRARRAFPSDRRFRD